MRLPMDSAGLDEERVSKLYNQYDYLDAYRKHTDLRVEEDPKKAIGGLWEKLGRLQFRFLVTMGLESHHKFLDVGCGTLRGGRHFIDYLQVGNYYGIDISPRAIEAAEQLVRREELSGKNPQLILIKDKVLKFKEVAGQQFDFILAHSVFTHLMPRHIEEIFENLGPILKENAGFFFTFECGQSYEQLSVKDFRYPSSFFESLATKFGFQFSNYTNDYDHPRGQQMAAICRCSIDSAQPCIHALSEI